MPVEEIEDKSDEEFKTSAEVEISPKKFTATHKPTSKSATKGKKGKQVPSVSFWRKNYYFMINCSVTVTFGF